MKQSKTKHLCFVLQWFRHNFGEHRIEAAKVERQREFWKRRNIEETMPDNLPREQQPLPESMIVDDKDLSLSETASITSTSSSNLD
jgi:hypothetical protein